MIALSYLKSITLVCLGVGSIKMIESLQATSTLVRISFTQPSCLRSYKSLNVASFALSRHNFPLFEKKNDEGNEDGVIELADTREELASRIAEKLPKSAPFLSQGDISQNTMPDLSNPKQTRVIIYILLSLLPVLLLIPFMLGSRDLIPMDALPPVDL